MNKGRPRGPWKDKEWREAVRMAVMEKGEGGKKKLRLLADRLVGEALEGDVTALKEIGDRLDGKPAQTIVGGDEDDNPVRVITEIRRTIVDPRQKGG